MRLSLIIAIAAGVMLLAAGCRVPPGVIMPPRPTEAPKMGAALYAERCAVCHGDQGEGKGKVGTSLNGPEFLSTVSDALLTDAIANGREGTTMSPWAKNGLDDKQIASLVQYIRKWQKTPSIALDTAPLKGDAARGKTLYDQNCASCHGPTGMTMRNDSLSGSSIGHPQFLAQASDAFIAYAIANGRSGTVMVPHAIEKGGNLSAQDIADIVTYMRTWKNVPPQ
ncbi:MAG: c-type cytochrome [Anaerolineae bacterium]